jgi:hypothetical protein
LLISTAVICGTGCTNATTSSIFANPRVQAGKLRPRHSSLQHNKRR